MSEIHWLKRYGSAAEIESPIPVDVRARVLRTIRVGRQESYWGEAVRPLAAVLAASCTAVVASSYYAMEAWSQLQSPLVTFVSPFVVTLQ